jgi:ABC-type phosphate/phosphonate transport system substrate-binding protein
MKKIITVFFAGVLIVSLVACSGNKKDEKTEQAPETTEIKTDPAAEAAELENALKDFESYVEHYAEVIKKLKAGNVSIAGEYTKLSQQKQQFEADMNRYKINFDEEQTKRWEVARTKLTDAIKTLSEKK